MTFLPPVDPLTAARAYLRDRLNAEGNPLPVGVTPPPGEPKSYALLSKPGSSARSLFTNDYLIRVRVFDTDSVKSDSNCELIWALLKSANHTKVTTTEGDVWITAATSHAGPSDLEDPDVPLWGSQCAVFWTIATKPL